MGEFLNAGWQKSTFSAAGNCPQARVNEKGLVELTDSKLGGDSPVITVKPNQWSALREDLGALDDPRELTDSMSGISITPERTDDGMTYVVAAEGQEAELNFNLGEIVCFAGAISLRDEMQVPADLAA